MWNKIKSFEINRNGKLLMLDAFYNLKIFFFPGAAHVQIDSSFFQVGVPPLTSVTSVTFTWRWRHLESLLCFVRCSRKWDVKPDFWNEIFFLFNSRQYRSVEKKSNLIFCAPDICEIFVRKVRSHRSCRNCFTSIIVTVSSPDMWKLVHCSRMRGSS